MNLLTRAVTNNLVRMGSRKGFHLSPRKLIHKDSRYPFHDNPSEEIFSELFSGKGKPLERLKAGVGKLELKKLGMGHHRLGSGFEKLDSLFEKWDNRLEKWDSRLEKLECRFNRIDNLFDQRDAKLEKLDAQQEENKTRLAEAQIARAKYEGMSFVLVRLVLLPVAVVGLGFAYGGYMAWKDG